MKAVRMYKSYIVQPQLTKHRFHILLSLTPLTILPRWVTENLKHNTTQKIVI